MKLFAVAATISLSLVSLTGCASATPVQVFECGRYGTQPSEYTPYCADLGQDFTKIKWSSWSDSQAVGKASVITNLCDPTCSAGKYETTTATITLTKPIKAVGQVVFSKLQINYEQVPAGHAQNESLDIMTGKP
jgi:hypothetical protein